MTPDERFVSTSRRRTGAMLHRVGYMHSWVAASAGELTNAGNARQVALKAGYVSQHLQDLIASAEMALSACLVLEDAASGLAEERRLMALSERKAAA